MARESKAGYTVTIPNWLLPVLGTLVAGIGGVFYTDHLAVQSLESKCERLNEEIEDLEEGFKSEQRILGQISKSVTRLEAKLEIRPK